MVRMSLVARTERQIARHIGRAVGAGAAVLVLAQVFVAAFAARANATSVYALQRSLVDLATGGGALVDPRFAALMPMFVATYTAALVAFAAGLVLCWQAGRLAALAAGTTRVGGAAGRQVMLVASLAWLVLSLPSFIVFQLDGTFSWLVGTLGAILLAPASLVNGTVYSLHPTTAYIVVQVVVLLVQELVGALVAFALGGVAGRLGGRRAPHGHHRVTDELLHRPAVAPDDVAARLEVQAEQLANVLGVALLGERREADEVGEQDADEPTLGGRGCCRPSRWRRGGVDEGGAALAAELRPRWVRRATARAAGGEALSALAAEFAPDLVLGATGRADHAVITSVSRTVSRWRCPSGKQWSAERSPGRGSSSPARRVGA